MEVHGPYVEFICNEYSKFPEEQKSLSPSLFSNGAVVKCVPGLRLLQNPCNLDPWGHYSSIIEATLLLDRKFKLRLPEQLSLLRAMGVTPNGAYLYVAAATAFLEVSSINPRHRKAYRIAPCEYADQRPEMIGERETKPPASPLQSLPQICCTR